MIQKTKIERQYETPLGIVRCGLNAQSEIKLIETKQYKNGESKTIETDGYRVEIIEFKIKLPLYNGQMVADSFGWIFRIEKTSNTGKLTEMYCLLDTMSTMDFDVTSGQYLNAIAASNNEWILHIGTEDGEMVHIRSQEDNWLPRRFENEIKLYQEITETRQNGFSTKVPPLNEGEKIHIQYLIAYDKADRNNVNTWLAVDETKSKLEKWIGVE